MLRYSMRSKTVRSREAMRAGSLQRHLPSPIILQIAPRGALATGRPAAATDCSLVVAKQGCLQKSSRLLVGAIYRKLVDALIWQ